jgi:hypothetical protein
MKKSLFVILISGLLLIQGASGSNRAQIINPETGATAQPFQQWYDAIKINRPTGTIFVRQNETACGGVECMNFNTRPHPTIYMFESQDRWSRFTFLHELGHVYDFQHRKPADHAWRAQIMKILGWQTWRVEDFAMAYSWCASDTFKVFPGYDYWPSREQHEQVCIQLRPKIVIQQAVLRTRVCGKPKLLRTRAIPATAVPDRVRVWMNGIELRGWQEGTQIVTFAGYGVIAQISLMQKTGPATVRVANALNHCVGVRVLLAWR